MALSLRIIEALCLWCLCLRSCVQAWNAGTSWRNLYAVAAVKKDRSVYSWGMPTFGGNPTGSSTLKDVKAIYSTMGAFVALMNNGGVTAWGSSDYAGNATFYEGINDVKRVYTTTWDVSLLHTDNTVTCIQKEDVALYTNVVATHKVFKVNCTDILEIYTNEHAAIGVSSTGVAYAWGTASSGGIIPPTMGPVKDIYASGNAFVGHQKTGKLRAWGDSYSGGCENAQFDNSHYKCMPIGLSNVTLVYSNAVAFAALKEDSSIVAWGRITRGGDVGSEPITGVAAVYSTRYAFAALKIDGTVQAWGDSSYGGNNTVPSTLTDVEDIFASERAFCALKRDKTIVSWSGGDALEWARGVTNVDTVFGNYNSFAALHTDGTVTAWNNLPGALAISNVKWIYGNMFNFYALLDTNTVIQWGGLAAESSNTTNTNLMDIDVVYATDITYAASVAPNYYACPQNYGPSRRMTCTRASSGGGGGGGSDNGGGGSSSSEGSDEETDESGFAIGCGVVFALGIAAVGALYIYKKREAAAARAASQNQGNSGSTQNPMVAPPSAPHGPTVSRQTAVFDTDSIYLDDTDGEFTGGGEDLPQYSLDA